MLGQMLKSARGRFALSLNEVADHCGVSVQDMTQFERESQNWKEITPKLLEHFRYIFREDELRKLQNVTSPDKLPDLVGWFKPRHVRLSRKYLGLLQIQFATQFKAPGGQSKVSMWESDVYPQMPTEEVQKKIADAVISKAEYEVDPPTEGTILKFLDEWAIAERVR